MLKWEIVTGDEILKKEIERWRKDFDDWFDTYNTDKFRKISREKMLSEESPEPRIYYLMCKTPEEIKERFPFEAKEQCSSCGESTDIWLETKSSFGNEYSCGMKMCPACAGKLKEKINEMECMIGNQERDLYSREKYQHIPRYIHIKMRNGEDLTAEENRIVKEFLKNKEEEEKKEQSCIETLVGFLKI